MVMMDGDDGDGPNSLNFDSLRSSLAVYIFV